MHNIIENQQFDEERALYHTQDSEIIHCVFAGEADGESVLKESRAITVRDCRFSLRYPFWHVKDFRLLDSLLEEPCRAPLWYCEQGALENTKIFGVKALRESAHISVKDCLIRSPEFGWKCEDLAIENSDITAEYVFFNSRNVRVKGLHMQGKYSFQYMDNVTIEDSVLDTKDAFWHSKNVTVKNSVVSGEYLAWFSENLTLIDCRIAGTQPLCYCEGLKLINCTMEGCDLSFEYSEVEATVSGHIDSIKNPKSGVIRCESVGEIIREDAVMECEGEVLVGSVQK